MKQITSLIAVERATYSASVVDKEIVVCNLECHEMVSCDLADARIEGREKRS